MQKAARRSEAAPPRRRFEFTVLRGGRWSSRTSTPQWPGRAAGWTLPVGLRRGPGAGCRRVPTRQAGGDTRPSAASASVLETVAAGTIPGFGEPEFSGAAVEITVFGDWGALPVDGSSSGAGAATGAGVSVHAVGGGFGVFVKGGWRR